MQVTPGKLICTSALRSPMVFQLRLNRAGRERLRSLAVQCCAGRDISVCAEGSGMTQNIPLCFISTIGWNPIWRGSPLQKSTGDDFQSLYRFNVPLQKEGLHSTCLPHLAGIIRCSSQSGIWENLVSRIVHHSTSSQPVQPSSVISLIILEVDAQNLLSSNLSVGQKRQIRYIDDQSPTYEASALTEL